MLESKSILDLNKFELSKVDKSQLALLDMATKACESKEEFKEYFINLLAARAILNNSPKISLRDLQLRYHRYFKKHYGTSRASDVLIMMKCPYPIYEDNGKIVVDIATKHFRAKRIESLKSEIIEKAKLEGALRKAKGESSENLKAFAEYISSIVKNLENVENLDTVQVSNIIGNYPFDTKNVQDFDDLDWDRIK